MMASHSELFGSSGNVRIVERRRRGRVSNGEYVARIDEDLIVDPSMLEQYCFASPTSKALDLVTVLSAVRFADRAVRRRLSNAWPRKIEVTVPVLDLQAWTRAKVTELLEECLGYLTGDQWKFDFIRRTRSPSTLKVGHTPHVVSLPKAAYVSIPYSDGLDSYAQATLLASRERDVALLCVFTDYRGGPRSWLNFSKSRHQEVSSIYSIPVPFQVIEPHHAEGSFRSRPFIFYSLAAYAAFLANSRRVLIPENGQGSIGGSLVLLGNEAPHRSCYPGFLSRLRRLLFEVLGVEIYFEHPGLLQTKGEVLRALAHLQDISRWAHKRSCSHDQRHSSYDGRRVHCGVCGGCLLRRVSMFSAGLVDPTEYLFADLRATEMESGVKGELPRALEAMKDVARNSVRDMQRLAEMADDSRGRLEEVALDISEFGSMLTTDALNGVATLLRNHKSEWHAFLTHCGAGSWVSKLVQ